MLSIKNGHMCIYYKCIRMTNPVTQMITPAHALAIDLQCAGGMLVVVSEKEEIHL